MNKQAATIKKPVLAGACVLTAFSVIAGIISGQFLIPLGCIFIVGGLLLFSMRLSFDEGAMKLAANAAFAVMIVVGAVLLFKGLTAGVNRQDDQSYTQSLGVTAQELLSVTGSEGTKYAAVRDGLISRRPIPDEYRAERAEDIGEVFIVDTVHQRTGSYTNGGTAYRTNVTIRLKSLKTGEILDTTTLSGSEPPSHVRSNPLDPNKDRYGSAPSEEKIQSAIASMISREKAEEGRKSRVTVLNDDELLELVCQKVNEKAGTDGWSNLSAVERALTDADPDFSIRDYGFDDLMEYMKTTGRFTVKERKFDASDFINYLTSADYVRCAD